MNENELTEEEFLAAYNASKWPHPALTADIALFRRQAGQLQLLLVQRGNHPYKDCWALPGGFFEPGETIQQTAARELEEETGISGIALELFGAYSTPGRDPRDWVVTCAFVGFAPEGCSAQAGDDAAHAQWFNVEYGHDVAAHGIAKNVAPNPADTAKQEVSQWLVLRAGNTILSTSFAVEQQPITGLPRARVLEHTGFAFDHYHIVAEAYLALQNL